MVYTSIGISYETKGLLDLLKKEHKVKSYDMLLALMANREKGALIDSIFGIAPGKGGFRRNTDEFERL